MFGLRRKRPDVAPACDVQDEVDDVRDEVDQLAADIIALHNLAYHPGRDCEEVDPETATAETYGRCTAILRKDGKL